MSLGQPAAPAPAAAKDPVWDPRRWLPTTRDEAAARGWDELDVVLLSRDAYVAHPAFGTAVIARTIER